MINVYLHLIMIFIFDSKKITIYFYNLKIRVKKLLFLNFYFFLGQLNLFFISIELIKFN